MEAAWRGSGRYRFYPVLLARLLLVGVRVTTGLLKTQRFGEFEATLAASRLVPMGLVPVAAATIILLELTAALGLSVPAWQRIPLTIARLLFCTFISYAVWRWVQGIDVPCHCFGVLFNLAPYQAILLNAILLSLTFPLFTDNLATRQARSQSPDLRHR